MSQIETVVRGSKRVESLLEEKLGASGRGLHEKVSSVEARLPPDVVRSIRWIATVRNKVVHEEAPADFEPDEFLARVDQAVEWLTLNEAQAPGAAVSAMGSAASLSSHQGIECVRGKVASVRSIGRPSEPVQGMKAHGVLVEIAGVRRVIELVVKEAVVLSHGDDVVIAGESDAKSGKLRGYAYRNLSKGIFGQYQDTKIFGTVFVIAGLLFCWAIFPLVFHLRIGLRLRRLSTTIRRSVDAVSADA